MAANYNFPDIVENDTFYSRTITIEDGNPSVPIDLTGATICMQLKLSPKSKENEADFPFTISDPVNGVVTLDSWDVDLKPGKYYYDLVITLAGITLTYIYGYMNVTNKVSEC